MTDALILSGGVAKGAFGAGVLSVLLGPDGKSKGRVDIHSLVAASSGALNGAFAASVLHAGTEEKEIARLATLWLEDASFGRVFEPSVSGIFKLRGASGEDRVLEILRKAIVPAPKARTIELRLVVANLEGTVEQMGGALATTYESVLLYDASTFESAPMLDSMFRTVTASAAFPGAFTPVPLAIGGRMVDCVDGGAVNNTPLGYALEHPFEMDRVFVVSPEPRVAVQEPRDRKGLGLITHLADMLVEERLYRDLREAYAMNERLTRLAEAVPDDAARARVVESLGWTGRKPITIVELRPPAPMPGEVFDGFFSRDLRKLYIDNGVEAARAWLGRA